MKSKSWQGNIVVWRLNVRLLATVKLYLLYLLVINRVMVLAFIFVSHFMPWNMQHYKSLASLQRPMFPLSQMRQRRPFLVFELNKITIELFKSNLLSLVVSTFAPERDHSGHGGRGGLILDSWFCGFPSKPARKQNLFFKIIFFL